jgi:adenosine deaminase
METLEHLDPDRIGHGVRSVEDPQVLDAVAEAGVTLEVCPGSNVALGVYADPSEVPLRRIVDSGIRVALGADDPLLFGSRLAAQYAAARALGFDDEGLAGLARGSIEGSRMPSRLRAAALAEVDAWLAQPGPGADPANTGDRGLATERA